MKKSLNKTEQSGAKYI